MTQINLRIRGSNHSLFILNAQFGFRSRIYYNKYFVIGRNTKQHNTKRKGIIINK